VTEEVQKSSNHKLFKFQVFLNSNLKIHTCTMKRRLNLGRTQSTWVE
jgi:hypothetical protein